MQVGVMTPDGMPATMHDDESPRAVSRTARTVTQTPRHEQRGTEPAETSSGETLEATRRELVASGDRAASNGKLSQACVLWERSLALMDVHDAQDGIRERIMLARRLEALLHSSTQD